VVVEGDTHIGAGNELFPGCCLGMRPQDKKLSHGDRGGRLRVGDHNTFREHVTIHPGTPHGQGETRIGSHGMYLVGSHVGHDSTVGDHVVLTNGAMVAGHTAVGDRVILGAMVGVHQFARVGELAMVGAGAMLSLDAPPFSLIQGDRARLVGVNLVGLQRAGVDAETAAGIKRAFRLLFWRGGTLTERVEAVRTTELARQPLVQRLVEFVEGTQRGICSPRSRRLQVEEGSNHVT
jgi:UDP-N-acetylglucosamine acyltransferase